MDNNNIERERRPDGPSSPHRCDEEKAGVSQKRCFNSKGAIKDAV